jgi:hypothetical protein
MTKEHQDRLLGRFGANLYADTATHTGRWCAIQAITDCTFATLTADNSDALASITLSAGQIICLPFTVIDLATGTLLAYKEPGGII